MKEIGIAELSGRYGVRRLHEDDVERVFALCRGNTQYYRYCGKETTREQIENDMRIAPPGIPPEQKYYVGFFAGETMAAVMDLIDGYPDADCAFIGFFMMDSGMQGRGIGSAIIEEVLGYLAGRGFTRCMLGIDRENPQSNHFWKKNGFAVVREAGDILVAERKLGHGGTQT